MCTKHEKKKPLAQKPKVFVTDRGGEYLCNMFKYNLTRPLTMLISSTLPERFDFHEFGNDVFVTISYENRRKLDEHHVKRISRDVKYTRKSCCERSSNSVETQEACFANKYEHLFEDDQDKAVGNNGEISSNIHSDLVSESDSEPNQDGSAMKLESRMMTVQDEVKSINESESSK